MTFAVLTWVTAATAVTAGEDFSTHYNRGLGYFQQKQYDQAREELVLAMAAKGDDPDMLRHLALASFMVKDYPLARNAAAQFLNVYEDPAILVLMGRSCELNGDLELAANIYQKLANTTNPYQSAAQTALNNLIESRQLPGQQGKPFFPRPEGLHGAAMASVEYDDNITTIYDQTGAPSGIDDTRAGLALAADYDAPVGERFYWGGGGLFLGNLYNDEAQPYEVAMVRGNLHAGLVGDDWNLRVALELDSVDYTHEHAFDAQRLAVFYLQLLGRRNILIAQGSVANEDWTDKNPDWADSKPDAIKYDVSLEDRYYLKGMSSNLFLRMKYQYQLNDTDSSQSTVAYHFNKGTLGLRAPLAFAWDTYIVPDISYEYRSYREPDPTDRNDRITEYSIILGKSWSKEFNSELSYRRRDTNSTVDNYDKTQNIYGLSMIYTF
ncbi:MAG: hypothetical protein FIB02_02305 [Desulfuromonas sp.]|nr:hypothetical protein [Desulfuromonas sp.]